MTSTPGSMNKRGGLGRGLAALIPTGPPPTSTAAAQAAPAPAPAVVADPAERDEDRVLTPPPVSLGPAPAQPAPSTDGALGVPGAQLREVAVGDVVPNPKQPRQVFDDEALEELSHSVREFGLLQPIVVRENAEGGYELIMGERRLRAARAAGLETVPAIVRDTTDDAMLRDALLENIHRVQLNPLEEAAAYQQLLEEFGATHEELATKIGRSRSSSGRPGLAATSSSWASGAGGRRSGPDCSAFPRSSGGPATTSCCGTLCWRTSTGSSSTRSRRRRPTSSCSSSSG